MYISVVRARKNRQKGGDKAKFNWKNTMAKFFYKIA